MASAFMIFFLGCWLAGQSGVSGRGTNLTQPETTLTPTHPGSVEPGTKSRSRKSPPAPPETGGTGPQQPDPYMTEPDREDGSESPMLAPMPAPLDLTCPIIIGLSTAATVLLLLLLVAFICFRKT